MQLLVHRLSLALVACLALASCGDKDPSPNPGDPAGEVLVSGSERIGWSQPAADVLELALFQFVIYVDGARMQLTSVNCASTATAAGFDCKAPLPPMTPGPHIIELASIVSDPSSGLLESSRSAPLRIVMAGISGNSFSSVSTRVTTVEGATLILEHVVDGLQIPADIAFSSNGTIFIAERGGTVRTLREGALVPDPALDLSGDVAMPQGGLLAIALDPRYDETGLMYTLSAVSAPRGGLEFMLARFRGVKDRFGERAVLLDRIPASPAGASGALRIGPDGKLYVGLDDAADSRAAGSLGSFSGKVLRLNADATTPNDRQGSTPIYSLDHPQPKALDWHPVSGDLWVVDGVDPSGGRLSAVMPETGQLRGGAFRTAYALPQGTGASSAAFYRGNLMSIFRGDLFVAAGTGRQLIRLRFDADNAARVTSVDRLLTDEIGSVRVVAEGRDGALYIASDTALYRLRP